MTRRHAQGWRAALATALVVTVTGCASDRERIEAIRAVNGTFRAEYEAILAEHGSKTFKLSRHDAFVAMRVTLAGLGLHTEAQDVALGYLVVAGPAPLPLSADEWSRVATADLPLLRRLAEPHVGFASHFVRFEPQGLDVVISASFVETTAGTEIALTVRLRETVPPRSQWPRREYLSPSAVRAGLDKIWAAFADELRAGPQHF
ncbi:hypothetical protein [Pseudogulbenkiania sp. MAI-1]|uniref:hypothetical protein n=1 Tax=Pseudogulbenkiania sp. MAI-1 TaxID=990370 RepID=UPI00045E7C7C|nr:hypothetical protein [Pseudogulbenkiania sp. MAI-1]